MPFFSVIIPTYNRGSVIVETVESVLTQEFNDYEVIVVDDGSTDDTDAVVAKYQGRIQFLRQLHSGPGPARNLGLQNARGRYVTFLDSDDIWFPWTLSSYWEVINACEEPAFVCGGCIRFTRADEFQTVRREKPAFEAYADYYSASNKNIWIGTCGVAIRADVCAEIGGFVDDFVNAEDSDLWMRLGTAPGFAHIKAPILFGYCISSEGISKNQVRTREGIRQMIMKERTGRYPGGLARERERWRLLTAHVRSASLACLLSRDLKSAWNFYRNTFRWNLAEARFKYLCGFWLFALRDLAWQRHRSNR